jgi:hypothetical protein
VWRNYAYAVNWVIFVGVAVWFWWRFMRDQQRVEMARAAEEEEEITAAEEARAPRDVDEVGVFEALGGAESVGGTESVSDVERSGVDDAAGPTPARGAAQAEGRASVPPQDNR